MAATLAAQLAALDTELLPQLLPALQAYPRAAAVAGSSRSVAERDWQAAEAAVCGDALQLFVTAGSMAAAAWVCGDDAAVVLSDWMAGPLGAAQQEPGAEESAAVWQLLSQHVATTLRGADRAFLLAAVDRANVGMDATGGARTALGQVSAHPGGGLPVRSGDGLEVGCCLQRGCRFVPPKCAACTWTACQGANAFRTFPRCANCCCAFCTQAWTPSGPCWLSACLASLPPAWQVQHLQPSCSTPS